MPKYNRKKQLAEINVVPYIDVMLVLLVIFMITAPLLSQGVKVDLPQAAAQPLSTKMPEPIIVSVDAQGNYYLNIATNSATPIAPSELETVVSASLKADRANQAVSGSEQGQRQVLVKGDKNVDYGKVVQAMVILQNAGAESVGLMTQNDYDDKSSNPK